MKVYYVLIMAVFVTLLLPPSAVAQTGMPYAPGSARPEPLGEVTPAPSCFDVINRAPYKVIGHIATNYYINEDGIRTKHRSNFRLESGESAEFCSSGPFFEGRTVELVIRTLVPIFRCKNPVTNDVTIFGRQNSDGSNETRATCGGTNSKYNSP